ncbi:D-alanine--D-alanine ligase [Parabacteroides pacaensis]|uniref:D-alanine--D-alanine ligase n=1 Tax=Parabacteroides pacaensis TaxID=2086575 RepID=UPI000D10F134|nr:D-alanine--D-alanine ligase [Parabacteroides pacaensis]
MKKNIAIVSGGDSSEIVVSLKSAEGIYSFIDKNKYNLYIAIVKKGEWCVRQENGETTPIDKNDFSFRKGNEIVHFDFAYITIHGTPGENGLLQGYFEMIGLPYSSCNVLVSALTFDKHVCKNYLKGFGIKVADSVYLHKGEVIKAEEIVKKLGLPVFVKPNADGSSFGVTKVKEIAQLQDALAKAFQEDNEVLIERFLNGTEVTCGCYKVKGKSVVFPLTEVVTENEFFDFDAKYNGQVSEITPARIATELTEKVQLLTSEIYDLLGAKGIIRVDYIIEDGEPYMLEVNTTPGMTATSFIPQQVRAAGLDIKEVMNEIIENEINN